MLSFVKYILRNSQTGFLVSKLLLRYIIREVVRFSCCVFKISKFLELKFGMILQAKEWVNYCSGSKQLDCMYTLGGYWILVSCKNKLWNSSLCAASSLHAALNVSACLMLNILTYCFIVPRYLNFSLKSESCTSNSGEKKSVVVDLLCTSKSCQDPCHYFKTISHRQLSVLAHVTWKPFQSFFWLASWCTVQCSVFTVLLSVTITSARARWIWEYAIKIQALHWNKSVSNLLLLQHHLTPPGAKFLRAAL